MIVWGGLISTSIAAMYLAGIIPGLLIAGAQMATVHVYAVRRGYPTYPKDSWVQMRCAIWRSLPALMTPFIIVGGILLGWFTATESACVAVLYSIALSTFSTAKPAGRNCTGPCSIPGGWPGSRCFAWAPQAHSAGCWPITGFRRRCWRTCRPGRWDRPRRA